MRFVTSSGCTAVAFSHALHIGRHQLTSGTEDKHLHVLCAIRNASWTIASDFPEPGSSMILQIGEALVMLTLALPGTTANLRCPVGVPTSWARCRLGIPPNIGVPCRCSMILGQRRGSRVKQSLAGQIVGSFRKASSHPPREAAARLGGA